MILAHALAGVAAAFIVSLLKASSIPIPGRLELLPAFLAGFILVLALCYVFLWVAAADQTAGNSYFGPAIRFTVMLGACAVGPISGDTFNPGVALRAAGMGLSRASPI